ncbi:MAG: Ig domain-containing protein [Bacteroidales bacterium]|nr:Ig domain-containing protein [Bacteroidales bacterium]
MFSSLIAGCGSKEPITPTPSTPTTTPVAVTEISLNKTTLTLEEGDTETLSATIAPNNATDKSVTWKSSSTDIVTVNGSGKVTAVKVGSATITATAGEKSATCAVTVTPSSYKIERAASLLGLAASPGSFLLPFFFTFFG